MAKPKRLKNGRFAKKKGGGRKKTTSRKKKKGGRKSSHGRHTAKKHSKVKCKRLKNGRFARGRAGGGKKKRKGAKKGRKKSHGRHNPFAGFAFLSKVDKKFLRRGGGKRKGRPYEGSALQRWNQAHGRGKAAAAPSGFTPEHRERLMALKRRRDAEYAFSQPLHLAAHKPAHNFWGL